jgi:hypothetical protein
MTDKTCAHVSCSCSVDVDRMYCSEACRRAAERAAPTLARCGCEHPHCSSDVSEHGEHSLGQGAR